MSAAHAIVLDDEEAAKRRRRKVVGTIIAGSLAVHVIGGVLAGVWVVAKYLTPPPATFTVHRDLKIPPKERENKMTMAEFDALTPKPTLNEKLASLQPTEFALPDLPEVPINQMLPLDPSSLVTDQVTSLVGTAGLGAGGEGAGGTGGTGDGFSFFGIEATGNRILLLFDVSGSVVNKAEKSGVPLSEIKAKTIELIENLGASSSFNLVQFTRNYNFFQDQLVPATDDNKAAARDWVVNEWTEEGMLSSASRDVTRNPEGLMTLLPKALSLEPDVVFLISDGSFQMADPEGKNSFGVDIEARAIDRLIKAHTEKTGIEVPINFIGFEMDEEDRRDLRRIFRRTGGTFREL